MKSPTYTLGVKRSMEYEKPAAHLEPHKARMWSLYLQHPDESPEWMGRHDLYLIHPPSRLASTAAWIAFRDKDRPSSHAHAPGRPERGQLAEAN